MIIDTEKDPIFIAVVKDSNGDMQVGAYTNKDGQPDELIQSTLLSADDAIWVSWEPKP